MTNHAYHSIYRTTSSGGDPAKTRVEIHFVRNDEPSIYIDQYFLTEHPERFEKKDIVRQFKGKFFIKISIAFKMTTFVKIEKTVQQVFLHEIFRLRSNE